MIDSLRGTEVVDVAAGGAHSACVTAAGDLYTWGKGRYGRLGHSDSEDQLKPKLVRSSFAWEVWRDSLPLSLSFFKNKKYFLFQIRFSFRVNSFIFGGNKNHLGVFSIGHLNRIVFEIPFYLH